MTYRELKKLLEEMPEARLDDDISIYDGNMDELFEVMEMRVANAQDEDDPVSDILDDGHYYLTLK